jgi:predicted SAM-dependent methyltransferase
MKLYIGCAEPPFHEQHLEVLGNPNEWVWIDKYVKHEKIKNWDGMELTEVWDDTVEKIYSSHTLEHFEHTKVLQVLTMWREKLIDGGELILNVPNLLWATRRLNQIENGHNVDGYYTDYEGEHGVLSVFYGSQSHEGEYHKSGYTPTLLRSLLNRAGYKDVKITEQDDAHEMGVIIAICHK